MINEDTFSVERTAETPTVIPIDDKVEICSVVVPDEDWDVVFPVDDWVVVAVDDVAVDVVIHDLKIKSS